MERVAEAIARAYANSPFLAGLVDRNADLMPLIHAGDFDTALANALARDADTVGIALRKQRQGVALVTAIADLAGVWDLTRVTHILSDFADHALDQAIEAAIQERMPGAPKQGFAVIDHAAIDPGHDERHPDQQSQTDPRENELAPRVKNVPTGQADHRGAPAMWSTTLIRLFAVKVFSL